LETLFLPFIEPEAQTVPKIKFREGPVGFGLRRNHGPEMLAVVLA
jgi:hypothetical protein